MPTLSWSQAKVLGEYSYGMVMTRRSGLSTIADFLGTLRAEATNFVLGLNRILCAVSAGQPIPVGRFFPEAWPPAPDPR